MSTAAIDCLTDEEVLSLARFARKAGKRWRDKIGPCFDASDYSDYVGQEDAPRLQSIRNRIGPEIVRKIKTEELDEAGKAVADAWGVSL